MPSATYHSVFSLAPYHIITYASVTGTTFFHSFINGIVMFSVLERPQFSAVQAKLFPIYFSMQTALPVALALTYPGGPEESSQSSVMGLLEVGNGWLVLAPLGAMLVSSALNLALLRPVTDVMLRRREQGMYFYLPISFFFVSPVMGFAASFLATSSRICESVGTNKEKIKCDHPAQIPPQHSGRTTK